MKTQLRHSNQNLREKQDQIDRLIKDSKRQDKEYRKFMDISDDKIR